MKNTIVFLAAVAFGAAGSVSADRIPLPTDAPVIDERFKLTGTAQAREDEKENQAVEAVRSLGGKVTRDKEKPGMPVVAVDFAVDVLGTGVTDEQLNVLVPLKNLTSLDLQGTKVTDAGLKELAPLKQLTTINLRFTKVSDTGLKELVSLTKLTEIHLSGTKVTDAGLKELGQLKELRTLGLGDTKSDR